MRWCTRWVERKKRRNDRQPDPGLSRVSDIMWQRRAITIPGYTIAWCIVVALSPVALPICAVIDLVRGTRLALTRVFAFALLYLSCELIGLIGAGLLFAMRLGPLRSDERYEWANYRLQWLWASALKWGAFTIFSIRSSVTVDPLPDNTPVLLLMRHASVADTILAACYLSKPNALRLRYVLKRELLWDPCLDVVGNRLPNHFVDRESDDPRHEQQAVAHLAADVGPGEGVLIYPEGTRYSAARRTRIIESAQAAGNTELEQRALQLVSVLPPRPGGTLALLRAMPQAQVMIGNHRGLEVAKSFTDLINGALIGANVVAEFCCVDRPPAGSDEAQCRDWLDRLWIDVDRFATEKS